jgi:putrescine carbamoyltransferase
MKLKRDFIQIQDFTKEEIQKMFRLIGSIKEASKEGVILDLLEGSSLAMIFEEPSTRTRTSFEVGMTQLGGHALYLKPGEIHLGERENIADTARVLARMCDAIEIRALKHQTVLDLAKYATVPVINGLTDFNHPTQVLCDVFTMSEYLPEGKNLEDLNVTFVGDATNVLSSLLFICTKMGMHFTHAAPRKYQAPPTWQQIGKQNCQISKGTLTVTDDVDHAVKEADFIYTDLWWWVGQEDEIPERRDAFMPTYQVNMDLLRKAPKHVKVMHCLPASRGVEATDEVLDSPQSIIFDQAENRLHTEKGLLVYFIYPTLKKPSEKVIREHKQKIDQLVKELLQIS